MPNQHPAAIPSLKNQVAVVAGGGSGLGRAVAKALARQGVNIVVADFDQQRTERTVGDIIKLGTNEATLALVTDVRNEASVRSLARDAIKAMGRVDILVNAAGVFLQGKLEKTSIGDWDWVLDTNLLGAVRTSTIFLPHMTARGSGHIVNAISAGGLTPMDPLTVAYDSGHAALATFTYGLAMETRGTGVQVSLYCPGSKGPRIGQHTRSRGLGRWLHAETSEESAGQPDRFVSGLLEGIHHPRFFIVGDPHEASRALLNWNQAEHAVPAAQPEVVVPTS